MYITYSFISLEIPMSDPRRVTIKNAFSFSECHYQTKSYNLNIVVCTHHEAVYPDLMNLIVYIRLFPTLTLRNYSTLDKYSSPYSYFQYNLKGIQLISASPISLSRIFN